MRALAPTLAVFTALAAAQHAHAEEAPITLRELLELAQKNDPRIREAGAEVERLEAQAREAFWAWFPRLESTIAVAGPTPEARNDGLGGPPLTAATRMYDLNFGKVGYLVRTEVTGFMPVYTFGKLTALRDAGRQGPKVGKGLEERARDEALLQAAQAYWGYQLAREGQKALQETSQRLEDAQTLIQKLLDQESTQVSKIDTYKLNFYRQQVQARMSEAQTGQDLARTAVELLAGVPSGKLRPIAEEDLDAPAVSLKPADEYVKLAEENRPELRAIEAGLAARRDEVLIRERLFYPDFGLAGFFRWMYTSSATRQVSPFAYDPYNDLAGGVALAARATFDVPIKMAQLDQSRAELHKLEIQKEELLALVRLEVQKAHGELADALARSAAQTDAEKQARRWATAAYANFEVGTTDTRELVDAFTALALSSAEKLRAWHDAQVGLFSLSRTVGKDLRPAAAE